MWIFMFEFGQADLWLRGKMLDQLKSYAGPVATDDVSKGWNSLFMEVHVYDLLQRGDVLSLYPYISIRNFPT